MLVVVIVNAVWCLPAGAAQRLLKPALMYRAIDAGDAIVIGGRNACATACCCGDCCYLLVIAVVVIDAVIVVAVPLLLLVMPFVFC